MIGTPDWLRSGVPRPQDEIEAAQTRTVTGKSTAEPVQSVTNATMTLFLFPLESRVIAIVAQGLSRNAQAKSNVVTSASSLKISDGEFNDYAISPLSRDSS